MKRKLSLLLVVLMLLAYAPAAYAAPGGLPSAERNDDEIDINTADVPLLELPTAGTAAAGDGDGTAAVEPAATADDGSGSAAGMWFAAAGLVLLACASGIIAFHWHRKSARGQ